MTTLIDLSHILEPDMPSYPGLPVPQFRAWLTHAESPTHASYAPGTTFQIAVYELGGNTGTYVDAPFHRHPEGMDLERLPLERLADLEGIVIRAPEDGPIGPDVFQSLDLRGKAVLVRTDWAKRWDGPDYFRSGP